MIKVIKDIFMETALQELLGFIFSVLQVILAYFNNAKNYLFGIAGILLTMFVMFNSRLYAEFSLNIYYLFMSIYGWLYWKFGKEKNEIKITKTSTREWIIVVIIIILSFLIFYTALTFFSNSDVIIWDSIVSSFAWAGMWLMAKRKLENWLILNISNVISIPLMINKNIYLYSMLSFILFCIAISGYIKWRNIILKNERKLL